MSGARSEVALGGTCAYSDVLKNSLDSRIFLELFPS